MKSRREFIATAPLALAGALAACSTDSAGADPGGASGSAASGSAAAPQASGTPRPLHAVPRDAPVLNWIPKHEDLCYTFGGVAPRQRIKPGTRIVTWTEDCFDGAVKTTRDLATKVMTPGHDNPQTGPFYIEGAE